MIVNIKSLANACFILGVENKLLFSSFTTVQFNQLSCVQFSNARYFEQMVQCANAENVSFIDLLIFLGGWGEGWGGGVNVTFFPFFNQIFSKLQVAEHFALILRSVWISDKTLCLVLDLASQTEKLAKKYMASSMRYPDLFHRGNFLLFLLFNELLVSLSRGTLTSDNGDGKDDEMFNFF